MNTEFIEIASSNGYLMMDIAGEVIQIEDISEEKCISSIKRFDVGEYRTHYNISELPNPIDILDIGYWHEISPGRLLYEPPANDWRREFGRNRLIDFNQREDVSHRNERTDIRQAVRNIDRKPRSQKQNKASTRNWQKARIMGMRFDLSIMTQDEREKAVEIEKLMTSLLDNWDTNSKQLKEQSNV